MSEPEQFQGAGVFYEPDDRLYGENDKDTLRQIIRREARREIEQMLSNPIGLPEEFKAYLVKYLEQSGMQLPVSQVVGGFLSETTTSKLGGDIHGRVGMVRGGPSPFDFFQLVFDKVYGKWVSNFFVLSNQPSTATTTSTPPGAEVSNTGDFVLPFESFHNAGIRAQFRLLGQLDNSTAGETAKAFVGFASLNEGDPIPSLTFSSWEISVTGTSESFKDTGWQDPPTLTVKDFMGGAVGISSSSGANTASLTSAVLLARWVSI